MDLYTKSPKERLTSYGQNDPVRGAVQAEPADYLKEFMNFMADLPNGYGEQPKSSLDPSEKEVIEKPFQEDYVKTRTPGSKQEFMRQYGHLLTKGANEAGISRDLVLAQIALETGWGEHTPGYNIGGIKPGPNWKGKTQKLLTTEYSPTRGYYKTDQTFRVYDSPEEGVKDYFEFLKKNKRYKPLVGITDPYEAIDVMSKTGYATDKKYKPKLTEMVKEIQSLMS